MNGHSQRVATTSAVAWKRQIIVKKRIIIVIKKKKQILIKINKNVKTQMFLLES